MDAVILAAGLGTRLRPHTLSTPKPLLAVQGRPILDWTLGALPRSVQRVIVVVNYLAEKIEDYLAKQNHFKDWVTVRQTTPRGTGDALRSCRGQVRSDRFLVLNGDDLYGFADLGRLVEKPAGMLATWVDEPSKYGIIFTRPDDTVDHLEEKPPGLTGRKLANVGAYLFPKWAIDVDLPLSPRGEYEITDTVTAVAKAQPFYAVPISFWFQVGTIDAWEAAQKLDLSALRRH